MTSETLGGAAATSTAPAIEAPGASERWTQWLARGAAHDRRMRERMRYATALIAAGFLAWLAFVIATG
jgi:hypothetical protein